VGTALERQRIPLSTWVRAAHEFSYEGPAYGKDKSHKLKPPPLTELETKIGVSYRTVLRMRAVIEHAAKKYRGYKAGFGIWPRSLMKHRSSPKLELYRYHKLKRLAEGKHPSQHAIISLGILADVMSGHVPAATRAAFDRTEVLLRLLLATPAKHDPRKRRKRPLNERTDGVHEEIQ
jgi:hypothetical protein